jgi:hypothetical protein
MPLIGDGTPPYQSMAASMTSSVNEERKLDFQ